MHAQKIICGLPLLFVGICLLTVFLMMMSLGSLMKSRTGTGIFFVIYSHTTFKLYKFISFVKIVVFLWISTLSLMQGKIFCKIIEITARGKIRVKKGRKEGENVRSSVLRVANAFWALTQCFTLTGNGFYEL